MQFKGLLYYGFVNIRYSLTIFWLILIGILLFSFGVELILGPDEDTSIYFTFSGPLYVFSMIMGYWMVKNMLPYLLKMGSNRMNLYVGYGILFLALSIFNAVMGNTINSLTTKYYGTAGTMMKFTVNNGDETTRVQFNHLADFVAQNDWFHRVMIDISLSFFFITVSFMIGLVFYRYRLLGGFSFLGVLFLAFIIAGAKGWIVELIVHLYHNFSFLFFYQLFGIGVFIYLLSYLLIRRVTI